MLMRNCLADHLSAMLAVNSKKSTEGLASHTGPRKEELISHSEHNESEVNAESMLVLAFNIRAHNRKSRRNASNSDVD